ncbi:MAG: HNH endonuclease signature motif containing protein [Candidatus Electrothrix sp. Rat3]|nr:HNH endonuclease signature motif containing protein [Candidatus Electrothrix rattekaaiensis]
MVNIDRNSFVDAEVWINTFFTKHGSIQKIADFLSGQIEYAHKFNADNWNLNLDINGKFLRFNIGQEYCIQIDKDEILVLCLRSSIPESILGRTIELYFRGYRNGLPINTKIFGESPDCLDKVPDSVGLVLTKNVPYLLPFIKKSNGQFIQYAISHTKILPQMRSAHSVGAVEYLSSLVGRQLPHPSFVQDAIYKNEVRIERQIRKISDDRLLALSKKQKQGRRKIQATTSVYLRNPYLVELTKRQAGGKCQDCNKPAPFVSKKTGEPYLEVHHIIPLAEDGPDSRENLLALCPNCHRKRHHG